MKLLNNNRFRIGLTVLLFTVVLLYGSYIYLYTHDAARVSSKVQLPAYGLIENDTNGNVPGDPKNGVHVLNNLYKLYQTYHSRHPSDGISFQKITADAELHPREYGYPDSTTLDRQLANPDNRFSDDPHLRQFPNALFVCEFDGRPNGKSILSSKEQGRRDVLAYTTTYYHENKRQLPHQRTTLNPVGFYQVLWDDGSVEEVPYDKILYVQTSPPGGKMWTGAYAFPGQAGVPSSALTYDQYWTQVAKWQTAPRGASGGKGIAYNGKSYR